MTRKKGNRTEGSAYNLPGAREETDGRHFHDDVLAHADYHLTYDNSLKHSNSTNQRGTNFVRHSTRSLFGKFECLQCPWAWTSGKICVEIWFSRNPDRYSTRIHSQKCCKCETYAEPQLDTDSYTTKLVDAFDLWKGLRERREPNDEFRETPPHHPDRCHGCLRQILEHSIEQRLQRRWIHLSTRVDTKPADGQRSNSPHRGPLAREEAEGDYLHSAVLLRADYDLTYDKSLSKSTTVRYGTRSVVGQFVCTACQSHRPKMWISGVVCAELWFSPGTSRYRTLLHSQRCKRCNRYAEPELDRDNYVHKIIRALDLWKGLRQPALSSPKNHVRTGPHDSQRCHGCLKGVCTKTSMTAQQQV
ncbi:hypothetical protein BGZ52_002830 [Haplosporangium bisporale]|nr:hypothetical protein BGZ52_002830 [Haplosporangium bisporale]